MHAQQWKAKVGPEGVWGEGKKGVKNGVGPEVGQMGLKAGSRAKIQKWGSGLEQ